MGQFLISAAKQVGLAAAQAGASALLARAFSSPLKSEPLSELSLQTSTEGAFIPIVYGRMRLSGQVIWTGPVRAQSETRETGGGKGTGPQVTEYRYQMSFAVALCEGPISGIGQIWANGEPLANDYAVMRWHSGAIDQPVDPLIAASETSTPAYRGLAYVVFEDFPLDPFGLRLPNLSFEVMTSEPDGDTPQLEKLVQGVCLIPGSGEFAYATEPVFREIGPGEDVPENLHTARAESDLSAALDDLQARLPHVRSVALVTSWFGTDLRCGACEIRPGVDQPDKVTHPEVWSVAGLDRGRAYLVSQREDGAAYGGTPSDASLIAAIGALKARGFQVTLYPFVLMDIPAGNALPDPYGRIAQPAYPWRGRITCHPAPGQPGTPDQTSDAAAQVAAFFGTAQAHDFEVASRQVQYSGPEEWSFSRFILHHAALAKAAGGVESLLIGSEMVGLTTVRDSRTGFPAVGRLKALAAEVRRLVGEAVQLSYAADWSEYFGFTPADGRSDRFFHLDPLWADPNINYVGIDWYAPLSDWREGISHQDAHMAPSIHDLDYLKANVLGGEGADWYYASDEDRQSQHRTPIADLAHGENWIWRYKDLPGWWSNPHHERINGERLTTPTDWVPQSKPIRLVELGCPAVDKGSNQPNVFLDPKSAESQAPYFSTQARDDLIQRRSIEALLSFWGEASGQNLISNVYGEPMLDLAHSHVWCWDARPYPEFPARSEVWSDGANWRRGHWLTGRAGQSSLGRLVGDVARQAGLSELDVSELEGVVAGYVIDRPKRARDVLSELGQVFGFDLVDLGQGPACKRHAVHAGQTRILHEADLVDAPGWVRERQGTEPVPADTQMTLIADDGDYAPASVRARGSNTIRDGMVHVTTALLADRDQAQDWAQGVLQRAQTEGERLAFSLPPSAARLEAGDHVVIADRPDVSWRIDQCEGVSVRRIGLGVAVSRSSVIAGPEPQTSLAPQTPSRPVLKLLDLPLHPGEYSPRQGLLAACWARPWPGEVTLYAGLNEELAQKGGEVPNPAIIGVLLEDLPAGPEGRWDFAHDVFIRLYSGALASASDQEVLSGTNQLAVETESGWDVLSFKEAVLQNDGSWKLSQLLRGLGGGSHVPARAGASVVLLDGALETLPIAEGYRDTELTVIATPQGVSRAAPTARRQSAIYTALDLKPLAPVHLRLRPLPEGAMLSWIRRTRIGGDRWTGLEVPLGEAREAYRVRGKAHDGALVFETETDQPILMLDDTQHAALQGGQLEVAQLSDGYGVGVAAHLNVSGFG